MSHHGYRCSRVDRAQIRMSTRIGKRNPYIAIALSAMVMGLGQLYNGQSRRAIVFFTLYILSAIAIFAFSTQLIPLRLMSFHGVIVVYFGALVFVGIQVFSIVDAFNFAHRHDEVKLHRYNHWYVYVPILFVMLFIQAMFEPPIDSYNIPSGAMKPTLLVGDYLYVNKNAYHHRKPERGDVVVFRLPTDTNVDYIKRLVALPGDKIQVLDGVLQINDKAVDRERSDDFLTTGVQGGARQTPQYIETLPGGRRHYILETMGDNGPLDNTSVYTVPEGHYFAMGDNRDNSHDSRILDAVGFIPKENLVGRAEVFYFSHNGSANWWQVWRWPLAIRFDRIGMMVDAI